MKIIFILIACMFLTVSQSQELKTIELHSPQSKEYSDLAFLKNELQDKQLVMIGEQTHMYVNIFEMKARVLEYLHQELGFTTIAMESSMYDIWKMNKNGFDPKIFNNAIWNVWSSSIEFQRVVAYIEKNNLKVVGFDSQVNNTSQFIEDFYDYLEGQNIALKLDEDDLGIVIEGVLENVTFEEDDIKFKTFEKEIIRIVQQIEKLDETETNYYWKQFINSLLASSRDAYYNKKEILSTDLGNKNHNIRDKQMAENLLSYIKRNPNEKIICWADNIHIIKDNSSITKPIVKEFLSMGSYIHKELKEKSYSLATIHANDSLFDYGTSKWVATPIKSNSFEYDLSKLDIPYLFVSSRQEAMHLTKDTRLLNFIDFTEARLDQLHDGYLFLKKATIPKLDTFKDSTSISEKLVVLDKEIKKTDKSKNFLLKGQLINRDNNEPIPFATLILRKDEIYRVADEKGFYELPINKAMQNNATVEISSMGFESKTISLQDLSDKTYLNPKFQELEEVVITNYLSPKIVLKKAIKNKKVNHPTEPFNFYRYANILTNRNDTTELDLELITKDYDTGYLSPYIVTQKVEQIKWNKVPKKKKNEYSSDFFGYRENAIRFANILHKRKYKKFKLNFVKSDETIDDGLYIIAFQTERNKFNYTNKGYPTEYSGKIYINRDNFAIIKVVENWETNLDKDEIAKFYNSSENYKNIVSHTIKEENVCYYSDTIEKGKFYATRYFNRQYSDFVHNNGKKFYGVVEADSYLYDFELKNVEEIEFEWREKNLTVLKRVEYDQTFWDSFHKRAIKGKSDQKHH